MACFVNNKGSFRVHDIVHDFWKKNLQYAHFFVVLARTKSLSKKKKAQQILKLRYN